MSSATQVTRRGGGLRDVQRADADTKRSGDGDDHRKRGERGGRVPREGTLLASEDERASIEAKCSASGPHGAAARPNIHIGRRRQPPEASVTPPTPQLEAERPSQQA